ncbi:MAG: formylglycine-generating enzyme family protein [Pyrinomonadaceae bacterium]
MKARRKVYKGCLVVVTMTLALVPAHASAQDAGGSTGVFVTPPHGGKKKLRKVRTIRPKPGAVVRNRVGMELIYVPPGSFMMGSESGDPDGKPVRRVTISEGFYMGRHEVTQAQWQAVMGTTLRQQRDKANPLENIIVGEGDNYPLYYVSWEEAQEFIRRLNGMNDGYVYRLPTEAEWEYACRAWPTGDYAGDLDSMAWYGKNSGKRTHPVGQKQANGFGLYDMHGNVWEWCQGYYYKNYWF